MDNKSYQDHFFKKAKDRGYRSRSAFKLIELNKKFKFLKNGTKLLDLGSFPGGWCQVAKENVKNGKILGLDKKEVMEIKGIKFIIGDFLQEKSKISILKYFNTNIDVILSDMASNTTGNKNLDAIRTNELCLSVINFSLQLLNKKGVLISKIFMGEDFEEIKKTAKKTLKKSTFISLIQAGVSQEKHIYIVQD